MTLKRWVAVTTVLLAGLLSAPGAWAMSAAQTDAAGDEIDVFGGSDVTDPRIDIRSLSIDNDLDVVEVTIEVGEIVPFTDPAWADGELVVAGGLHAPRSKASWALLGAVAGGAPVGIVTLNDDADGASSSGCPASFRSTSTAYVLRADGACAHGLSRSIEWAAVGFAVKDATAAFDIAPDQSIDAATTTYFPAVGTSSGPTGPARLAGTDRILTATAVSADSFTADSARAVVLASAEEFPDALAGGPFARYQGAPLLLTGRGRLDARTRAEMERVLAPGGVVYVLGGTAALADQVVLDVGAAGFDAKRVAGRDRFATAAAIADAVSAADHAYDAVLLADGRSYTDAVLAAAAAPARNGVVLLTDGARMPASTAAKVANGNVDVFAIGAAAANADRDAEPITGATPSELSVNVAERLVPISGAVAIASQRSFADALAGGPHIASHMGPLLLTDTNSLPRVVADAITAAAPDLRRVLIYGGTAAVSRDVETAIASAMQGG